MEFLKALQQAQTMGLTKEEFLSVWESESKLMLKTREALAPQWNPYTKKQNLQNQDISNEGSSVDSCEYHIRDINQQSRQEISQDLYLNLDHFCKHIMDKQEQLWQQINLKCDQLLQELRSRFDVLSNYVNDIADSQANSLKLFFMHEMELLKQDRKRLDMDQNVRSETNLVSSEVSSHQIVPYQSVTSFNEPDNFVIGQLNNDNKPEENLSKSKRRKLKKAQKDLQLNQCDLPKPGIDLALTNKCSSTANSGCYDHQFISEEHKLLPEIIQNVPVKSYASVASLSIHTEKSPTNYSCVFDRSSDSFQSAPNFCASSAVNTREESVAATGLFASLISNQMKHKQSSQVSSVKSSTRSEISAAGKDASKTYIPSSLTKISSKHHKFTITNCSQLSVSNQPFLSPFIVSTGKACKARISVRFEKSGQLTVQVLVSKGIQDDNHKWPLILNGYGYIFHPGSKQVTPLWRLESATCQKPLSSVKEFSFPTQVCLMTSMYDLNNVKYKELIRRYKAEEDNLVFTWELQATERQKLSKTKQSLT